MFVYINSPLKRIGQDFYYFCGFCPEENLTPGNPKTGHVACRGVIYVAMCQLLPPKIRTAQRMDPNGIV